MNANSLFRRCFPCRRLPRLLRSLISECPQQEWNLGLSGYRLVQLLYHWATGDSWKLLKAIKLDWFDKHFGLLLVSQSGSVREGTSERRSREGTRPPPQPPPQSRLLSRVTRACTFHDIPQMESLLAGYQSALFSLSPHAYVLRALSRVRWGGLHDEPKERLRGRLSWTVVLKTFADIINKTIKRNISATQTSPLGIPDLIYFITKSVKNDGNS